MGAFPKRRSAKGLGGWLSRRPRFVGLTLGDANRVFKEEPVNSVQVPQTAKIGF